MPYCPAGALRLAAIILSACAFAGPARASSDASQLTTQDVIEGAASGIAFDNFLDRLMRAELGGRDYAANPRSTALGPFQFIKGTFMELARRHFPGDVANLTEDKVLELRTNRDFARRAAAAYSLENHAFLTELGLKPDFGHLRLAFLLGPGGAARVMQAPPETPVSAVLGPAVVKANPFMLRMSASDLIAKASRDVADRGLDSAPQPYQRSVIARPEARQRPGPATAAPTVAAVKCNTKLVSCRRFVALKEKSKAPRHSESRTRQDPSQEGQQRVPQRVKARTGRAFST